MAPMRRRRFKKRARRDGDAALVPCRHHPERKHRHEQERPSREPTRVELPAQRSTTEAPPRRDKESVLDEVGCGEGREQSREALRGARLRRRSFQAVREGARCLRRSRRGDALRSCAPARGRVRKATPLREVRRLPRQRFLRCSSRAPARRFFASACGTRASSSRPRSLRRVAPTTSKNASSETRMMAGAAASRNR